MVDNPFLQELYLILSMDVKFSSSSCLSHVMPLQFLCSGVYCCPTIVNCLSEIMVLFLHKTREKPSQKIPKLKLDFRRSLFCGPN